MEDPADAYPPPPGAEPHWPPQLAVAVAIGLQLLLPARLTVGPKWLLPVLEAVMLLALVVASPQQVQNEHSVRRRGAIALAAVVSFANGISLLLLTHQLLHHQVTQGRQLIIAGTLIWLTNVLIFSLWYWEVDRGGPGRRAAGHDDEPDFLFPQMSQPRLTPGWRPRFVDYLYVSLTNATAFSPTDAMPLTATVKSVMGLQAVISLATIGLVISRAVNIL
jgi:uncharacterized membrane protein